MTSGIFVESNTSNYGSMLEVCFHVMVDFEVSI